MPQEAALAIFGYHGAQREQIMASHGGAGSYAEELVSAVFTRIPLKDNYFWWVYLAGSYHPERCPGYLRKENFETLRERIGRLSVHNGSMTDFLGACGEKVSVFVLLDHMDWLWKNDQNALMEEWEQIASRARQGSRIIWRSTAPSTEFVDALVIPFQGTSRKVGELIRYDEGLASELHRLDRTGIYQSFRIAAFRG